MKQEELLSKFIFTNSEEKAKCEKYIKMKGLVFHERIAEHLGLDEAGKIQYEKVADYIRYDKRLRDNLYTYLAMFEERIRAYIGNKYNNKLPDSVIPNLETGVSVKINKNPNLMAVFEELTFGELQKVIKALPETDKIELFEAQSGELADQNLKAIKELRNKICHSVFLLLYEGFENCIVNGVSDNTLLHNLKNFSQCMVAEYRAGFIKDINACEKNLVLPAAEIIRI